MPGYLIVYESGESRGTELPIVLQEDGSDGCLVNATSTVEPCASMEAATKLIDISCRYAELQKLRGRSHDVRFLEPLKANIHVVELARQIAAIPILPEDKPKAGKSTVAVRHQLRLVDVLVGASQASAKAGVYSTEQVVDIITNTIVFGMDDIETNTSKKDKSREAAVTRLSALVVYLLANYTVAMGSGIKSDLIYKDLLESTPLYTYEKWAQTVTDLVALCGGVK